MKPDYRLLTGETSYRAAPGEFDGGIEMICPECNGEKKLRALCRYGDGSPCRWESINCWECGGTGEVTQARLDAIEKGRGMRKSRLERNLTLREEATRLGITPQELSHKENGRF